MRNYDRLGMVFHEFRTNRNISLKQVADEAPTVLATLLQEIPQLLGVKESDYDMTHITDTAVAYQNRLAYLCGNDDLFLQFLSLNAAGIISAASCVLSPAFVKIYNLFKANQPQQAFTVFAQISPLVKACYLETNPTCIKYVLAKLKYGNGLVRLPLGPISAENQAKLDGLLAQTPKEFLI